MKYNIFIKTFSGTYNILDLDESKLPIIVCAYKRGVKSFTISGKEYSFSKVLELKFFTYETRMANLDVVKRNGIEFGKSTRDLFGYYYFLPSGLSELGKDVTEDFIGDEPYGGKNNAILDNEEYVNSSRIEELKKSKSKDFDLSKLIQLCKELNSANQDDNYFTVGILVRAIMDHIPPIFSQGNFSGVANNYQSKGDTQSFKKSMLHLDNSMKNISDSFLHSHIRKSEVLPNETSIDCKRDLDKLLGEIVRILK